jgi:hypothetical protein
MRNTATLWVRSSARARSVAALLVAVAWSFPAAVAAEEDPRRILADAGLTNLGDAWLCPAEVEARRWFDALDPLERQYQALQKAVDDRIRANEAAKGELNQKKRDLKALLKKIEANDPAALGPTRDQLKQTAKDLDAQVKQLRKVAKDATKLAEFQPAREEVIRLANARAALTLAAAALRGTAGTLPKEYERLGNSAAVRGALAKLPQQRLGMDKNYVADAAERLARIERTVTSNVVPAYCDDHHARVLAIVNGATPVTFSLRHSNGPTHLPHSLVTSLGISTENAPTASYTVGSRKLTCRVIKLDAVQLGGVVLKNVEVLALPPEGEDLGAKLGRAAYDAYYFDVDFSQLRLTIMDSSQKPVEPPKYEEDGKSPTVTSRSSNSPANSPPGKRGPAVPNGMRSPRGR